ncbi:quinone oxidoreductase-like protein 2 homolog isoform X2 [Lineus longissimus]
MDLKRNLTSATSEPTATYKAVVCKELWKPLVIEDRPREPLRKGQVRLQVHSAGINFADILLATGRYVSKPKLPFLAGSELAGEVIDVGDGVGSIQAGDRVVAMAHKGAAFAEECVLPENLVWKIPDSLSYATAAALVVSYGTAYMALKMKANIKKGDTVLVTAAAGALGLASIDLALNVFGASKVIGCCGGEEKAALVQSRGAHHVIDYNEETISKQVQEFTEGKGVDIVMEMVGGDIFKESFKSMGFGGRIILAGFASNQIPRVPGHILLAQNFTAIGIHWGLHMAGNPAMFRESVEQVVKHTANGAISPKISDEFPMSQVNEAYKYISDRKSTGKVLLSMK